MANIALVTAGRVNVVRSDRQFTAPAGEAIVAGAPIRLDTATGRWTNANASSAAESRVVAVATKSVQAGEGLTGIEEGIMDGYDLSGLAYDADVFLSDTDGRLGDASGSVLVRVGRVVSGFATTLGTAADKLLMVDMAQAVVDQSIEASGIDQVVVTSELLAGSVDKHVFVANRAYRVAAVREIHSVVGGAAAAVRPRKILSASASAPGAAAGANVKELTAAVIDLTAAADTVQSPALSATAADLNLAAGDKISLDFSGTLTGLVGLVEIVLQAI